MRRDDAKIGILWLIREKQPIGMNEFMSFVLRPSENTLPRALRYMSRSRLRYILEDSIEQLIEVGLVQLDDAPKNKDNKKLVTTSRLGLIQDLFDISLTEIVNNPGKFIKAYPIFSEPLHESDENWSRIFVAMPFSDSLRPIYTDHVLKVANILSISCTRGDDFFTANRIMDDVWSAIYHAELCIVDCTGRNPNVFYELGIAHTLGRKAILIAQTIDDIPFDVRDRRVIIYNYTPPGMKQFEETLTKTIQQELELDE